MEILRIHFDIEVSGGGVTSDYREHFIYILKEAFKGTEGLYQKSLVG